MIDRGMVLLVAFLTMIAPGQTVKPGVTPFFTHGPSNGA